MTATENSREPERIRFRPISDGLGFHPFADGLPYAPANRSQLPPPPHPTTSSREAPESTEFGASENLPPARGAVSAQVPVFPVQTPPRAQFKNPPPVATGHRAASGVTTLANPQESTTPVPESKLVLEPRLGLGFMFKRSLAFVMDSVILTSLVAVMGVSAGILMNLDLTSLLEPELLNLEIAFGCAFLWSLITAQEVVFSTTLGKRLFDLRVEGSLIARILRSVFLPISILLLPINLIIGLIDRKQRLIHEWCSGTSTREVAHL
jgi:hypothetical protein